MVFYRCPSPALLRRHPPPVPFDCDPFLAHEDLRGKTVEELREYFEGPLDENGVPPNTPEVTHVNQLLPGQSAFLAPQVGRLKKAITLASGEAATVVTVATLPRDSYIFVEELPNKNNSTTLEGLHITQAISLCMDGKSVICVATNRTIGTLTVGVNSPICQLSVVRPDFESAVLKQQQDRFASPASPVSCPGPRPPPSAPAAPVPCPPPPPRPPRPEKKVTKRRPKKKKTINYISEIVPKHPQFPIRSFANNESDEDIGGVDPLMPGLLPAGQVGSLEDGDITSDEGSDDEYPDLPDLVTTDDDSDRDYPDDDEDRPPGLCDEESDDGDYSGDDEDSPQGRDGSSPRQRGIVLGDNDPGSCGDGDDDEEDHPPGLLLREDHGDESDDSEGEEAIYSRKCFTCQLGCVCPVDISSSQDELVVGEASAHSAPSSDLRKGKKDLEDILNKTFSHETWKFGKIVQPNQPDSDSDEDDPNIPFDWKSLPPF